MSGKPKVSKAKVRANEILEKLGGKYPPERSPVTLSLNAHNYRRVASLCEKRGVKPSHLIDELIAQFLDEAAATG